MTDAFRCDVCGEYHDGTPAKTYYEKDHDRMQKEYYREAFEICSECDSSMERAAAERELIPELTTLVEQWRHLASRGDVEYEVQCAFRKCADSLERAVPDE